MTCQVLKKPRRQETSDENTSRTVDFMSESRRKRRRKTSRQRRYQLPADDEQELLIEESNDEQETVVLQETHPVDHDRMCLEEEDEQEAEELSGYQWLPSNESRKETAARLRHVVESGEYVQLFENLKQDHPGTSTLHGQ